MKAAAVLLSALVLAPIASGASAGQARTSHLLVYAQEWSLWPSRTSVPAGPVSVELWNRGQDMHDLRIRRLNAHGHMTGAVRALAATKSGTISTGSWRLTPGRYELFCGMPGHLRKGMHTTLVVRGG